MKNTIFVKYSNQRDDRYKIKTVISEDETGNRYVEKYPLTKAAEVHIEQIAEYGKQLEDIAADTKFTFNKCDAKDGVVHCEYITGTAFSSVIGQKVMSGDEEGALKLAQEYCGELYKAATVPFAETEAFAKVFGRPMFDRAHMSWAVTDIDMVFANLLIRDSKWSVLDYEWTFAFPIPVKFVMYRTIIAAEEAVRMLLYKNLQMFDITDAEYQEFEKMEAAFQLFVKGEEIQLHEFESLQKREVLLNAGEIVALRQNLAQTRQHVNHLDALLLEAKQNLAQTGTQLQNAEEKLRAAESALEKSNAEYLRAEKNASELETRSNTLSAQLEEAISFWQTAERKYEEEVSARQAAERMMQIVRQNYEGMETHYNKILRSRGWSFLNYLYDLRNKLLPANSFRYKLVRMLVRPVLRLRRKIRKLIYDRRYGADVMQGSDGALPEGRTEGYQPMPAELAFEKFKTWRRIDIMAVGHTAYIAEMLQSVLLDAGFESCIHLSELEQYEDIPYIMICPQNFKRFPPVYIAFQMEQTVSNRWLTDEYLQILRNAYAIFDYSMVNIKYFSNEPTIASKLYYLPVDVCNSMMQQHPDENEKEYDVLFYGAPFIERRQEFLKPISEKYNFCMICDKFGTELYEQMKKAKIIVNVHYYQNALLETTRIYETLSVSDCLVISERSKDPKEEERLNGIVDFVEIGDVQGMLDRITYWLEHEEERKEKVAKNREELKHRANAAKFYMYRFLLANECVTFDRFYNSVGDYIHFDGNRVCLSLPESTVRHEAFEADNKYGFEFFPGLKHRLGWIGCGMSYKFMFRKALEQKLEQILICEDDVYFPPDFDERFNKVLDYTAKNNDWTVFSGIMADLGRVTPLKYVEEEDQEYIYLNKMISMVFNLYDRSIFEAISTWDNMNRDVQTNTIDRYLENREMRILTTCPFLVGHKEDLCSTIWGGQNTIYSELITNSSVKLREIVDKFKDSKIANTQ